MQYSVFKVSGWATFKNTATNFNVYEQPHQNFLRPNECIRWLSACTSHYESKNLVAAVVSSNCIHYFSLYVVQYFAIILAEREFLSNTISISTDQSLYSPRLLLLQFPK